VKCLWGDSMITVNYLRELYESITLHVEQNVVYEAGEIREELREICNEMVEKQIFIEKEQLNLLYRYYQKCRLCMNITDDVQMYVDMVNLLYLRFKNSYEGVQKRLLGQLLQAGINSIIMDMCKKD